MSNAPNRATVNARITRIATDKTTNENEKVRLLIDVVDEITEELLSRGSDDDEVEDHKDDEHDTLEDRINTLQQLDFLKA